MFRYQPTRSFCALKTFARLWVSPMKFLGGLEGNQRLKERVTWPPDTSLSPRDAPCIPCKTVRNVRTPANRACQALFKGVRTEPALRCRNVLGVAVKSCS